MPRISRRTLALSFAALAVSPQLFDSVNAAPAPEATPDPAVVNSPAGLALQWVISVINGDVPMPTADDLTTHFSVAFLEAVPADQMIAIFEQLNASGPVTVDGVLGIPTALALDVVISVAGGEKGIISITVEEAEPHLIVGLLFQPYSEATPVPQAALGDWSELETALSNAGPLYSVYSAEVLEDGSFAEIYQSEANPVFAIGSLFKIYVLGALAKAVGEKNVAWDDTVEVTAALKSLPSGVTQNELNGTKIAVKELADRMISISDNTATDMLITYLGRPACEDQLEILGNSDPERTMPMLKTREMFTLKLGDHQELAVKFIAGDIPTRHRVLEEIAGNPLPPDSAAAKWTKPIAIDSLEWFATASDLAHAMSEVWNRGNEPGLSELQDTLSINPGVPLDDVWTRAAFKGGSEPGVLALCWRLERSDGRTFVLACGVNNPDALLPETELIETVAGAIALLGTV